MDFFRPGLDRLELRQIRATNTISSRILDHIKRLNVQTIHALISIPESKAAEDGATNSKHELVRKIFTEFYYDAEIGNEKLAKVPEVSIDRLITYQERLDGSGIVCEEDATLKSIIDHYTRMIALHHLANAIIHKTLMAKIQIRYWRDVKGSATAKLIYGVQSLPWKCVCVVSNVFQRAKKATNEPWSLHKLSNLFVSAFKEVLGKTAGGFHGNFVVKSSRLRVLKIALGSMDTEVKGKIDGVNTLLEGYYHDLGLILNNTDGDTNVIQQILDAEHLNLVEQLSAIQKLDNDSSKIYEFAPPNVFARYWPLLLLIINYGPSTTLNAWKNRQEIAEWVKLNFFDTVVGFWNNWIVKPIGDMLSILRNDDTMAIASKESLQLDLDSLERMVEDFVKDNGIDVSPEDVRSAVSKGDLTMMMSQYENDIRTPYRSIVRGLLVRSMLIQVQKTKVDGSLAINGIDKLLKLQQLLFGILSISPSLFIVYQANKALSNKSSLQADIESKRIDCLRSLNQIEKLVNRELSEDKLVGDGKLFVEIVNLTLLAKSVVPNKLRSDFHHDLNELAMASSDESLDHAGPIINRIWNMYSPYFRN